MFCLCGCCCDYSSHDGNDSEVLLLLMMMLMMLLVSRTVMPAMVLPRHATMILMISAMAMIAMEIILGVSGARQL